MSLKVTSLLEQVTSPPEHLELDLPQDMVNHLNICPNIPSIFITYGLK